MLRELEHGLRVIAWQQTKDGQSTSPQHFPDRIDFHGQPTADGPDLMTRDEMAQALGWAAGRE